MNVSIIAAMDNLGCIGRNNQLPWHLSADLKRFKLLTMGHTMVMGRRTYESIGRPLPGRTSIVITRKVNYNAPGCLISSSFRSALELVESKRETEVFIIGGAQVFSQALPLCRKMFLTLIQAKFECDVYFPEYDPDEWKQEEVIKITDDPNFPYAYSFVTLVR